MNLILEPYQTQNARRPQIGRRILAQFDEHSIVVYQAYRPSIGYFATRYGYFGAELLTVDYPSRASLSSR